MFRRRNSTAQLYRRLSRPSPVGYARAVLRLIIYRVAAVVAAGLSIALYAFLGSIAGYINNPRWPAIKSVDVQKIRLAAVYATPEVSHWLPLYIVLGAIVVSIPHAHRWIFRLVVLGGAALGYYQRHLPPYPTSGLSVSITKRAVLLTNPIRAHILMAVAIAPLIAYLLYYLAYILALRTTRIHNHRSNNVSLTRQALALLTTTTLLLINTWLARNIRTKFPGVHYIVSLKHITYLQTYCLIATLIVTFVICMSRLRSHRLFLITLLIAITVWAISPQVDLLRMPTWIPKGSTSFWALIIAYLFVTGFGFDLISALFDWPIRLPSLAKRL